jgi:glucosyl-dolichyl phosphate glucuronosyltransferase
MFSIIVPTFNRASLCVSAVQSVLVQDANVSYEVIVVDNNSTDETRERIQALCRQAPEKVRYVFERRQGASAARNAGIAAARGDIIACIDDDVVVQPGWLCALTDVYRTHPDAWCVGGRIVLALPEVLPRWFHRRSHVMTSYLGRLDLGDATIERRYPNEIFGGNFTVRREALDLVGFFDTALGPVAGRRIQSEETDLCWRIQQAGRAVYYCGAAVVAHVVPAARLTKQYFRTRAYWGGKTWLLVDRKDIFEVRLMDLVRAARRVVRNTIWSWVFPRRFDPWKAFEDELRFWQGAGYHHQALLTRLGVLKGRWSTASQTSSRL